MVKQKSIDYILGMITGASLMLALWACTSNDLIAESIGTKGYSSDNNRDSQYGTQNWQPNY